MFDFIDAMPNVAPAARTATNQYRPALDFLVSFMCVLRVEVGD
jgi:hypothetical protein